MNYNYITIQYHFLEPLSLPEYIGFDCKAQCRLVGGFCLHLKT